METPKTRKQLDILLKRRVNNLTQLALDLNVDYGHLHDVVHGRLAPGGDVRARIEPGSCLTHKIYNLYSKELVRSMGNGFPRWGVEGDAVMLQIRTDANRAPEDPGSKEYADHWCSLVEFGGKYTPLLNVESLARCRTWRAAAYLATLNIVCGHLLATLGDCYDKSTTRGAPPAMKLLMDRLERHDLRSEKFVDVRAACLLGAREVFWALYLDLARLGAPEANQAYALIAMLGVMSRARPNTLPRPDGLVLFQTGEIVRAIEGRPVELVRCLLKKYKPGHPHRLLVANNLLSMGGFLRREDCVLEGWAAMVEEDPACGNLEHRPEGLRRAPGEDPDLKWIIERFGRWFPGYKERG